MLGLVLNINSIGLSYCAFRRYIKSKKKNRKDGKNEKRKIKKRKKGITLVALVITVVIMLILAGVAIAAVVDGDGLFSKTREATEIYENAVDEESQLLTNLMSQIDTTLNEFSILKATADINVKLVEGMVPVTYNEKNHSWYVATKNEIENNSWFAYVDANVAGVENQSKWANVMLRDNLQVEGVANTSTAKLEEMYGKKVISEGSMYVWIPRYAYKIVEGYHTNQAGEILIEFLNTDNTYKDESCKETLYLSSDEEHNASNSYILHPAFSWSREDGTPVELEGIWVGKFEASSANATFGATEVGNVLTSDSVILRTVGNVISWRNINRNNIFLNCYNMNNENNASVYGISTNKDTIDPHLIKNMEWGAAAYLTHSEYGKNGVEINRNGNSDYKTGSGDYKTNLSMSTTGNVYGIYDMSGGAWEHVAAYVDSTKNGSAENIYLTTEEYGKALYEAAPKYKDVYVVSDEESGIKNYEENYFVYGDAVYETSYTSYDGNTDGTNEAAWHSDRSSFPYRDRPFFNRGGAYKDGYKNGVFAFASTTGTSTLGDGFRVTLTVL